MTLKRMLGAVIFTTAFVVIGFQIPAPAFGHELATKADIANLKVRADQLESGLINVNPIIDDLYAQITNLKARADTLEGRLNNMDAITQDLYEITDELKARLDTGAVVWNQNEDVGKLYEIVDALRDALGGVSGED